MQRLKEIDIIRCIVIIILVMYHSFAPFAGAWELPCYLSSNAFYEKLGKFLYSGMLETFVCISGYVFAYNSGSKDYRFKTLFISKLKRLYIPCLAWGIIYILIMYSFNDFLILKTYYKLIDGIGHLWFLPMLFWCFIFEFVFLKYQNKLKFPILFLAVIAVLPYFTFPLRINNALYYLFFFNLGVVFFHFKDRIILLLNKRYSIVLLISSYLLLFSIGTIILSMPLLSLTDVKSLNDKALIIFSHHIVRFIYSTFAVLVYFSLGYKFSYKLNGIRYEIIKFVATYSFGIYLLQEIVLQVLYYKVDTWGNIDLLLPWINFVIAFIVSLLISYLLGMNKFTKLIS